MELQQTTTIPEVKETIVKLRELSADEQLRRQAFYREKRLHDEASALGTARREGEAKGLEKGLALGRAEGEASATARIAEQMRKYGVSEEQIKLFLGE